jgi:hypothetical protein
MLLLPFLYADFALVIAQAPGGDFVFLADSERLAD